AVGTAAPSDVTLAGVWPGGRALGRSGVLGALVGFAPADKTACTVGWGCEMTVGRSVHTSGGMSGVTPPAPGVTGVDPPAPGGEPGTETSLAALCPLASSRAVIKAPVLPKRSLGSFARAVNTTCSTAGERLGTFARRGAGGALTC